MSLPYPIIYQDNRYEEISSITPFSHYKNQIYNVEKVCNLTVIDDEINTIIIDASRYVKMLHSDIF